MQVWYQVLEYRRKIDDSVVRRIPVKQFYCDEDDKKKWIMKITIWNTKKFKKTGQTKFFSYKTLNKTLRKNKSAKAIKKRELKLRNNDAWEYTSHIEFQGMKEGWYDPSKLYSSITPVGKRIFYEKWGKYNEAEKDQ